jgi:hypothetical protein
MTAPRLVHPPRDEPSRNKVVTLPFRVARPKHDIPAGAPPEDLAWRIASIVSEQTGRKDRLFDVLLAILLAALIISGMFFLHESLTQLHWSDIW